jgi:membrane-bound lytic murein transglycosylase MltF
MNHLKLLLGFSLLTGCIPESKPPEPPPKLNIAVGDIVYYITDTNRLGVVQRVYPYQKQVKVSFKLEQPYGNWMHGYRSFDEIKADVSEFVKVQDRNTAND